MDNKELKECKETLSKYLHHFTGEHDELSDTLKKVHLFLSLLDNPLERNWMLVVTTTIGEDDLKDEVTYHDTFEEASIKYHEALHIDNLYMATIGKTTSKDTG